MAMMKIKLHACIGMWPFLNLQQLDYWLNGYKRVKYDHL